MAKDLNEVKPPSIPVVGAKLGDLNGWKPSEDPFVGRFVDKDDDGPEPPCIFEDAPEIY